MSNKLYVPTLKDSAGLRHIIPGRDRPAYCGATGEQLAPENWRAAGLCQRCVQHYLKYIIGVTK